MGCTHLVLMLVYQVSYDKLLSSLPESLLVCIFGSILLERRIVFCAQQFRYDSLTTLCWHARSNDSHAGWRLGWLNIFTPPPRLLIFVHSKGPCVGIQVRKNAHNLPHWTASGTHQFYSSGRPGLTVGLQRLQPKASFQSSGAL